MMDWGNLPLIVLLEIYSYLPQKDRLLASSVCRRWRYIVFQIPLCQNLNLIWKSDADAEKVRFLSQTFVHKAQFVRIVFDVTSLQSLDVVSDILDRLERNRKLSILRIRCIEESMIKENFRASNLSELIMQKYFTRKVVGPLLKILQGKNCLESFSFPLVQQLAQNQTLFYSALANTKVHCLQNLFLVSMHNTFPVKDVIAPQTDFTSTNAFQRLQILSVNHEILTDEILSKLGQESTCGGIKRFSLFAVQSNPNVSEYGWQAFVINNPSCGVRLTVVGEGVEMQLDCCFVFLSVPLTHLRAFYCKTLSPDFINLVSFWNELTLEYLEVVHLHWDFRFVWRTYFDVYPLGEVVSDPCPLIYAAWKCKNLKTIKIGFPYCGYDLMCLGYLRGHTLKRLEIPRHKIVFNSDMRALTNVMSAYLDQPWKPVKVRKFPSFEPDAQKLVHIFRSLLEDEY